MIRSHVPNSFRLLSSWAICLLGIASMTAQALAQATNNNSDANGTATETAGFLDIVLAGGWVGISIMLVLLALSLTAAYLVFEHAMTLRHGELMPAGLADQVREAITQGNSQQVEQLCRQHPSFLSFVLLHGINGSDGGWHGVEKALEDATAEQAARLGRRIEYLAVIGNIAPMVGLLGTVTGMIFAFQQVATTQGAASAADLAEGIYQALVTTVGGLIIAIPALGAFAIFRNRLDMLVAETAYLAMHALSPLKRRKPSSFPPPPPPPPPPPSKPPQPRGPDAPSPRRHA